MTAAETLLKAHQLVGGDREKTHGNKSVNHWFIAHLWNGYLSERLSTPLSASDVALMMVLLKVARTKLGAHNPDDFIDMAGYAGVAAEIRGRE